MFIFYSEFKLIVVSILHLHMLNKKIPPCTYWPIWILDQLVSLHLWWIWGTLSALTGLASAEQQSFQPASTQIRGTRSLQVARKLYWDLFPFNVTQSTFSIILVSWLHVPNTFLNDWSELFPPQTNPFIHFSLNVMNHVPHNGRQWERATRTDFRYWRYIIISGYAYIRTIFGQECGLFYL